MEINKFDVLEIKMVTNLKNKDEEKVVFL